MMGTKTTITFSLDIKADKALLAWLEHQPNRSAAIRAALEAHVSASSVTLGDVLAEVREVNRKLDAGITLGGKGNQAPDDDTDLEVLGNLSGLGLE